MPKRFGNYIVTDDGAMVRSPVASQGPQQDSLDEAAARSYAQSIHGVTGPLPTSPALPKQIDEPMPEINAKPPLAKKLPSKTMTGDPGLPRPTLPKEKAREMLATKFGEQPVPSPEEIPGAAMLPKEMNWWTRRNYERGPGYAGVDAAKHQLVGRLLDRGAMFGMVGGKMPETGNSEEYGKQLGQLALAQAGGLAKEGDEAFTRQIKRAETLAKFQKPGAAGGALGEWGFAMVTDAEGNPYMLNKRDGTLVPIPGAKYAGKAPAAKGPPSEKEQAETRLAEARAKALENPKPGQTKGTQPQIKYDAEGNPFQWDGKTWVPAPGLPKGAGQKPEKPGRPVFVPGATGPNGEPVVLDENGIPKPMTLPPGVTAAQKDQTKSPQYLASGFGHRLEQAMTELDTLESKGYKPQESGAGLRRFAGKFPGGNYLMTAEDQKQEQAERNFINANLRRESGAAIAPEEFESGIKQYFPRPGDTPGVLAQKKRNRQQQLQMFRAEAGQAWAKMPTITEQGNLGASSGRPPGKYYSKSTNKTLIVKPDGSEEILDGRQ